MQDNLIIAEWLEAALAVSRKYPRDLCMIPKINGALRCLWC
ncbi:hypothetical protein RHI9324_04711 [Rhizobium sp. CECT 9324]|nr:hypothetical protein RHI9324_04711 [Rhizobium sp. CECT 9324]